MYSPSCAGALNRRGEEVVYQYSWILERNDKALLQYFFVQDRDPPLLCLLDLPEHGSFWDTPGRLSDDDLYGAGGLLCTEVAWPTLHGSRNLHCRAQISSHVLDVVRLVKLCSDQL